MGLCPGSPVLATSLIVRAASILARPASGLPARLPHKLPRCLVVDPPCRLGESAVQRLLNDKVAFLPLHLCRPLRARSRVDLLPKARMVSASICLSPRPTVPIVPLAGDPPTAQHHPAKWPPSPLTQLPHIPAVHVRPSGLQSFAPNASASCICLICAPEVVMPTLSARVPRWFPSGAFVF